MVQSRPGRPNSWIKQNRWEGSNAEGDIKDVVQSVGGPSLLIYRHAVRCCLTCKLTIHYTTLYASVGLEPVLLGVQGSNYGAKISAYSVEACEGLEACSSWILRVVSCEKTDALNGDVESQFLSENGDQWEEPGVTFTKSYRDPLEKIGTPVWMTVYPGVLRPSGNGNNLYGWPFSQGMGTLCMHSCNCPTIFRHGYLSHLAFNCPTYLSHKWPILLIMTAPLPCPYISFLASHPNCVQKFPPMNNDVPAGILVLPHSTYSLQES